MFRECYYRLFLHFGQQGGFNHKKSHMKAPVKLLDSTLISLCMLLNASNLFWTLLPPATSREHAHSRKYIIFVC